LKRCPHEYGHNGEEEEGKQKNLQKPFEIIFILLIVSKAIKDLPIIALKFIFTHSNGYNFQQLFPLFHAFCFVMILHIFPVDSKEKLKLHNSNEQNGHFIYFIFPSHFNAKQVLNINNSLCQLTIGTLNP